jgi:superfamily II DNA or RNA helicase
LINSFTKSLGQRGIPVTKFEGNTPNKEQILSQFAKGKYKVLMAMKCLDEGIDIPRAEYAVFCSSTGNPRQFIQRRGRVLRRFGDKTAKIYDIIIQPDLDKFIEFTPAQIQAEKNIFRSELFRVINFAAIAENRMSIVEGALGEICTALQIDNLIELINTEYNNQNIEL